MARFGAPEKLLALERYFYIYPQGAYERIYIKIALGSCMARGRRVWLLICIKRWASEKRPPRMRFARLTGGWQKSIIPTITAATAGPF